MATTQGKSADKAAPSTTPAAKKSPGRKTTARKDTAAKAAAPKSAAARKPGARKTVSLATNRMGAEQRYRMVEVAAYFLAERNNFSGSPVEYWTQAEAQITQMLGK